MFSGNISVSPVKLLLLSTWSPVLYFLVSCEAGNTPTMKEMFVVEGM